MCVCVFCLYGEKERSNEVASTPFRAYLTCDNSYFCFDEYSSTAAAEVAAYNIITAQSRPSRKWFLPPPR